jgi:PAS domain S-box-containing protein
MPPADPASPHGHGALRRIVRLTARALGADAAQFVPLDERDEVVVYGEPADLRGLGLAALVKDERGLVVTDTVGTPPFSRLAPSVRFVAAVPVEGRQRLGVLCVLGNGPRTLGLEEQQTLAEFGYLAADVVESGQTVMHAARSLFDGHGALMLLIDPRSGAIVEANAAAAAFYGQSVKDLTGQSLASLSLLSEDRVLPTLRRTLQEEEPLLRLRHRAASGGVRTVEMMVSTVVIGGRLLLYAIGRDVTEQQRAAERVRRDERVLRGLYDHAPTIMGVVELAGDDILHVSCNEAAARLHGATVDDVEGRTASELGVSEGVKARWVEAYRQSALSGGTLSFTYEHPHSRGHRHLEVTVRCIGLSDEGVPQFSYVAADATEQEQVGAALRAVQGRSEAALRRAGDLLASIDHEVRAPLAALVGFSEALDEAVAEEHRDVSGLIVQSGHRLLNTIDSMLDLARLEQDRAEIERTLVSVGAEVEAAAQLLRPLAERKGLRLDVRVASAPPVPADAALLGRVVHTLIGDALAFTEAGGVTVDVRAEQAGVALYVRDTGASLNETFLSPRAGGLPTWSGAVEEGGMGVTRRLVDLLGGTMEVTSRREEGTTFAVRLPYYPSETHQASTPSAVSYEG